jgi:hypothetical protein
MRGEEEAPVPLECLHERAIRIGKKIVPKAKNDNETLLQQRASPVVTEILRLAPS